jgi:hypothetical protein
MPRTRTLAHEEPVALHLIVSPIVKPRLNARDGPRSGLEPLLVAVELDAKGFIKTGSDLSREELSSARWPLARPPHLLETNVPGVFAVGDVRGGSIKRVASAMGEDQSRSHSFIAYSAYSRNRKELAPYRDRRNDYAP